MASARAPVGGEDRFVFDRAYHHPVPGLGSSSAPFRSSRQNGGFAYPHASSSAHEELRSQIPYIGAADLRQDESKFTGKYIQRLLDSCTPSRGRTTKHGAAGENEPGSKAKCDDDIGATANPAVDLHLGFFAHDSLDGKKRVDRRA